MAANITALIDKLPNASKQVDVLEDLKTVLGSFHPTALRNIVPNISFNVIFECLNTNDSNQLESCCEVLKKLLSAVDASVLLHHFHDDLLLGLKHPGVPVKLLSLSQICRVSKEAVEELAQNVDIVQQLVRCIADDNLEVAKTAGESLIAIGISSSGLDALYIDCQQVLSDVLAVNDTIRFRVYEVIIEISKASIIGLQRSSEVGLLIQVVNELQKDDILVQLNCLEYLSDLALTDHGLLYLDQQGVVGTLGRMMSTIESDPLAGFLIPGLMKFFGSIARVHPKEVCSRNRNFVNIVFSNLSSKDQSLCNIAIQTVGLIGSTLEGKLALEKLGSVMDGGVKCLGKLLRDLQPDLKIKVLQSLSSLLELKVADQSMDMLKLLEKWYTLLGSKTFDYLMSLTQIPFTEVRCSAFSLLRSLAFQPWGQRLMNDHPGFNEYLLDRSTEQTKEGKEAKYEIVSILAESPTSGDIFGQPYQVKLKAYALQGPFYKRVQAEVAIDENN
ncbi:hypothetical protein CHS0354_024215 [Potamilus streckersoni]|uniref:26S proteasome non-ATPase regulatory subunit 5 n=1 Tax=Potamilus streckersoni TaxID=2493646 RepID=A0AAE0RYJ4_9BIVA|nr:hypothetical protein CHS0354_024215 [Potamilus streckersoni]